MKISFKTLMMTLLVGLMSTACEQNILEPRDSNQQLIDRVLRDPAYAEGLLHSAYSRLPSAYDFSGVATDDAVTNEKASPYRRMATGEWSALFSPVSVWDDAYAAIFHLNYLLSVAKDVAWSTQSENRDALFLKKNTGEAYALRGYFYLQLLAKHGGLTTGGQLAGVPIVTEPLTVSDVWQLPRASFREVLSQINADFDAALALLPPTWQNAYTNSDSLRVFGVQNQGRIQGKIIEALKAKTALLAASPAYNGGSYSIEQAAVAATRTGEILKAFGGLAKLPAKGVVFYDSDKDITNPEILWRTDYFTNNALERENYPPSLAGFGRVNPTQNLVDAFPMKNGYPTAHPASGYDPKKPYTNRDARLATTVITPGSTFRDETIDTGPNSPTLDGLNRSVYSTRTGYYLKKLLRADVNLDPTATSTRRHFYTHIRYTELYLNYAEAANEAWGPDADPNGYGLTARSVIAKIRQRANPGLKDDYLASLTSKEALRELIRNERWLELSFEGFRFWDLRRWKADLTTPAQGVSVEGNTFNTILVENRVYSVPAAYYGPIPQDEISKNNLIQQNVGW